MGIASCFSVWRLGRWNVHFRDQEKSRGLPVGNGTREKVSDLMVLPLPFHPVLHGWGRLGPFKNPGGRRFDIKKSDKGQMVIAKHPG